MARWHKPESDRLEAPAWYRTFDLAAWDEPDAAELVMMASCDGYRCWPGAPDSRWPGWPQFLHVHAAKQRWGQAKYAYLQEHPAFATQTFEDIRFGSAVRRV